MNAFIFQRVTAAADAASVVGARPGAMFLAGGTTLVDLMKVEVLTPDTVVSVPRLAMSGIDVSDDAIAIGATVTNSQLAWHPVVRDRYPVLAEALLSGATTQIRNMATVAGNILQRTRCPYFRDVHASCNRRQPGSGCDALEGFNRGHAVLGVSEHCIATHPSDMCVALTVLDTVVHTLRPDGTTRSIPFRDVHLAPAKMPHVEVALEHGELITHIVIPHLPAARRSHYLKVRDRASYEFALASAAVVLDLDGDTIEGESAPPGETSSATMIVQAGRFIPFTPPSAGARAHAGGYAAHFVEVHVDSDLGTIRVARVVSAIDGGRILNPKTARSQIIGGIAMGIGMALLEETGLDRTGRLATTSLAEYVIAANADVRDLDVLFVGGPDSMTPLGAKGVGELAITGMAAAIANAVYHATGTRIRSLPVSIEKVLGKEVSGPRTSSQRDVNAVRTVSVSGEAV